MTKKSENIKDEVEDSPSTKKNPKDTKVDENMAIFKELIRKIVFLTVIIFLVFKFVFGIKIMPNEDMSPKIGASDLLFYYRIDKEFLPDDVVVLEKNNKEYVSRVVALAGDEVDITESGLVINGALQANQNIYYQTGIYQDGIKFPLKLKEGEVFVLGDLREGAVDSRYFGPVKINEIKGKVFTLLRRTQF